MIKSQNIFNQYSQGGTRIQNPERGWYHFQETGDVEQNNSPLQPWIKDVPETIILRVFYMRSFRFKAFTTAQINGIRADFQQVRTASKKIIPKFSYGKDEPDAPLHIVLQHLDQLRPIFSDYQDIILTIQAGFIGYWGEWHSSSNNLLANKKQIMEKILSVLPTPITASIRYPKYKFEISGSTPISEGEALSRTSTASRISFHNDCFLASEDDRGTYQSNAIASEKDFIAKDSRYLINGGETCEPFYAPRSNCNVARQELRSLHFTYLNNQFFIQVLNTFRAQSCYEEITDNLGYRLFLQESNLSTNTINVNTNFVLSFTFKLVNRGYAAPIFNRPFELVLVSGSTRYFINLSRFNTGIDLRKWYVELGQIIVQGSISKAQFESELSSQGVNLSSLIGKSFSLRIRLPDRSNSIRNDPKYAIGFVNSGVYDSSTGLNDIRLSLSFSGTGGPVTTTQTISPIGCFKDESTRDLPTFWGNNFEKNSCAQKARSVGHRYFGLQYHGECFSGPTYGRYGSAFWTSCLTPCNADSSQFCGGAFANFIYELKTNVLDVEESNLTDDTLEN